MSAVRFRATWRLRPLANAQALRHCPSLVPTRPGLFLIYAHRARVGAGGHGLLIFGLRSLRLLRAPVYVYRHSG
jgi:hypothetical protein